MCVRVCNARKCTDIGTILTIIFGSDRTRQIPALGNGRGRARMETFPLSNILFANVVMCLSRK